VQQRETQRKLIVNSVYSKRNDMAVKVLIPTPLQKLTGDQATVQCDGATIGDLIESLETNCPGIKARLCDEQGKLRRFVNFYLNSEDIRFLEGEATAVEDGDEVSIVPAIAGG
jgi:sulfur-carrier protein